MEKCLSVNCNILTERDQSLMPTVFKKTIKELTEGLATIGSLLTVMKMCHFF